MNFFQRILFRIFKFLYPSKIYGLENVTEGGAVVVCNHFSVVDCGFMLKLTRKKMYFLAKQELSKNKIFWKILSSYGAIAIDRDNPSVKTLFTAFKLIKKGHKLVIFPEGTRNKTRTSELQTIKSGSAVFAVKAKCPIIPVMILKKARMFRKTHVLVGKPFTLEEFYSRELDESTTKEMDDVIASKMKEVQGELNELLLSKKKKKNDSLQN